MGDTLKDQLIALGLAAAEDSKKKHRRKPARKSRPPANAKEQGSEMSLDAAYRLREKDERKAAEQKKLQKQEQDRLRRKINAEIQQIVDAHALNDPAAELKRNFLYKGRIRSVAVTKEQLQALNSGSLGVVFVRGGYYLLKPEQVEAARAISADHVPDLGADDQQDADEEFPVPDDLMW
jgi:hypothetical protein